MKALILILFLPSFLFSQEPLEEKENKVLDSLKFRLDSIKKNHPRKYLLEHETRFLYGIEKAKLKCDYYKNDIDPIEDTERIITEPYSLHNGEIGHHRLSVRLSRIDNIKYIAVLTTDNVGCASPYESNISKVVFLLENSEKIEFYHEGDLDCGDFKLDSVLTEEKIELLKQSDLKLVRLYGTEGYTDVDNIYWKTFFKDKLICIE